MAGRPSIIPSQALNLKLPEDIHAKLTLYLYSEVEKRVPKGAYQAFFIERINEFFSKQEPTNDPRAYAEDD